VERGGGCIFHRGTIEVTLTGELGSGEYGVFAVENSKGLKQMNSSIAIYLYDKDFPEEKIAVVSYKKVKDGASWAWFDGEESGWLQTFAPTPGGENVYQQFQTCESGKMINPETGNCVKIPAEQAECPEGQFRNPETGRCKKLVEEVSLSVCPEGSFRNPETGRCKKFETATVLAACPEGSYRNPETNRCRKLATETVASTCQEGYERNPETNRCRKVVDSSTAKFAVEEVPMSTESNIMIGAAAGGIGVTLAMIGWSFRQDIWRVFSRIVARGAAK
jgi:hypothetical protein